MGLLHGLHMANTVVLLFRFPNSAMNVHLLISDGSCILWIITDVNLFRVIITVSLGLYSKFHGMLDSDVPVPILSSGHAS